MQLDAQANEDQHLQWATALSESEHDSKMANRLTDLERLLQEQNLQLQVDEAVVAWLARESFDPEYGARPLRRLLRRRLENPLATELLEERYSQAKGVAVRLEADSLTFVPVL